MASFSKKTFAQPLLLWHAKNGRSFPWMTKQPYDVWLSEIMLQQTQVVTVLERFPRFKEVFPTVQALADSSVEEVLAQWSGLGYYRRAKNLHATAKCLSVWLAGHGEWPKSADQWLSFPGIGLSTANAIVSACFDTVAPILDANAKRVLLRFANDIDAGDKIAWKYATSAMDVRPEDAAAYTQAIMDLGATICMARKTLCMQCPLAKNCGSAGSTLPKVATREKVAKKEISFDWVCNIHNGKVLLALRNSSSFWPDLWVFPERDARFKPATSTIVVHELSHRRLKLSIANESSDIEALDNECWVPLDDISNRILPVPSPVSSWLTRPMN